MASDRSNPKSSSSILLVTSLTINVSVFFFFFLKLPFFLLKVVCLQKKHFKMNRLLKTNTLCGQCVGALCGNCVCVCESLKVIYLCVTRRLFADLVLYKSKYSHFQVNSYISGLVGINQK